MGPSETQTQKGTDVIVDAQSGDTQTGDAFQQNGTSGDEADGAQKSDRNYSEAEVREIVTAGLQERDRERTDNRRALSEAALRVDVAEADKLEQRAQDADRQRVAEGDFTQAEADNRSQGRIRDAGENIRTKIGRQQEEVSMRQVRLETNEMAKTLKANEAAKANNVDLDELVKWVQEKNPAHPDQIDLQAERMALEKEKASLKGTDTFDSNRPSTRGVSMDDLSPLEKISRGVSKM